ncbi:MAG TPA: alkaline phosphatase family protein, partial [Vicinamibacterales bacterium]|nr:alkaline phosphatase family protein [Vicinamibacterales bacterium]
MQLLTRPVVNGMRAEPHVSDLRHHVSGATADAVVFLLVDALRHDYVGRTRFLADVAARSVTGQLEEPFGFCPRGAYFGGLTMAEQGYTNLFRFDPARSPFGWTRELAGSAGAGDASLRAALRPGIVARAKAVVPPFAAMYLDPLDIPLPWLSYFDVCERVGPASASVGYRSLFHDLDGRGDPWLDVSWPYLGWTGPLTSGRVAGMALEALRPAHRFAFIHLPELDMIGHAFGPGSRELQAALEDTDRLCELLCARIGEIYRDPVIVIAGDHGMLPVVRRVDVAQALAATGLRFGDEIAYFIDSTMVRLWGFTPSALPRALDALAACGGGRLLDDDDWRRYGLAGIDARNGQAIVLADPGVLFTPNFFDWGGNGTIRGMHGYAPDVIDNRAALMVYRPHAPGS